MRREYAPRPEGTMADLWAQLREHRAVLWITTVAAWSHMHYLIHGPPAHLLVLPGLAFAVFFVVPLFATVWHDSRDQAARALATVAAGFALWPALIWGHADNGRQLLKADASPAVIGAGVGTALVLMAMARGGVKPGDWGLSAGDLGWWWKPVGGLLLLIVVGMPVVCWLFPEFAAYYPRYKPGRTDLVALLQYQLAMGAYMFCWEFFFRGFMLFGLRKPLGDLSANLLQASPFFLLHHAKPEAELISSWFGGLLMGWLCLKARCMWPSFLLHWVLYSSMELNAYWVRQLANG
jgi:membrane protease YdiL (CAAX protease family)